MSNLVKIVPMTNNYMKFKSHANDPNVKTFYDPGDLEKQS